ncbi:fatty acid phospholipid synthesis protein PlsX [Lactobacillus selangorensis]|uniref:Phosphate acyltransferase n=1 Tax=Lactobacillus selangorensis TaxID=81857 RepID=A0A0R2FM73_9LACO|nr:phosphate acyltransferase PlsX [Lactobacillus selangorensis]KRN29640.1 fatty acid phospholipid synthesis protein PlsX [Lactobacillus selangorensis]KRN33831.1 fatty acid phospholipid synthesis protein PlsX [Lactobacillus selangorensis]
MKIAVDAMGGDHAPQVIVEGVERARDAYPDLEFTLYGREQEIRQYLKKDERITIVQTDVVIDGNESPVKAIRSKKDASMVLAANAVKSGDADALFSLGSTGALLAAGLFIVGRIKGIERPGLMPTLPAVGGGISSFNMLDVGANAENRASQLYQYALMGSYYAHDIRHIEHPRIGLLNNGTEPHKGDDLHQEAFKLIAADKSLNFVGNVEASNLFNGPADVVVTDGFTGNATLKAIEGTANTLLHLLKHSIMDAGVKEKLGGLLLKQSLGGLKTTFDTSAYGGAVLLGLKAPIVKAHGAADSEAVYYTVRQIREMLHNQTIQKVVAYFSEQAKIEKKD